MFLNRFALVEIWHRVDRKITGEEKLLILRILSAAASKVRAIRTAQFKTEIFAREVDFEPLNGHNILLCFDNLLFYCPFEELKAEYKFEEETFHICKICGKGFNNTHAFKSHFYTVQCLTFVPFVNIHSTINLISNKLAATIELNGE